MEKKQFSLPTIIAAITLVVSISGWAIKTTVSNMILENSNADLRSKVQALTEDVRWCRMYGGSFPMSADPEQMEDPIITIPPYLFSEEHQQQE